MEIRTWVDCPSLGQVFLRSAFGERRIARGSNSALESQFDALAGNFDHDGLVFDLEQADQCFTAARQFDLTFFAACQHTVVDHCSRRIAVWCEALKDKFCQ